VKYNIREEGTEHTRILGNTHQNHATYLHTCIVNNRKAESHVRESRLDQIFVLLACKQNAMFNIKLMWCFNSCLKKIKKM
jgi:hypothetical protein